MAGRHHAVRRTSFSFSFTRCREVSRRAAKQPPRRKRRPTIPRGPRHSDSKACVANGHRGFEGWTVPSCQRLLGEQASGGPLAPKTVMRMISASIDPSEVSR